MTVAQIQVDQRVIGIDSRRFASVEKALVELITNSDDSYARLERAGGTVTGTIVVGYQRHHSGAVLMVTDQAEGMSFEQAGRILSYGGAHSPLARGEGSGRGYFGRGLKQAIFGLGHGWIETIQAGRFTRIDIFRGSNGGYLYDDDGADRQAFPADYARLDLPGGANGTRVTIVVDNPHATITQQATLLQLLADNIYLRDVLDRRTVEFVHGHPGDGDYGSHSVRFMEPPAVTLVGPDEPGSFSVDGAEYAFTVTLKRAQDVELTLKGDERTAGLVVESGMAVLDCQMFEYENQVGTEYLFGTVRCPALTEMLGKGRAIISDEREGLNPKDPFVAAFSRAVSRMIAAPVQAEREKLTHLERATTSGRTAEMIEHLLQHMSEAAILDLGLETAPGVRNGDGAQSSEHHYRRHCGSQRPSITGRRCIRSTLPCCWIHTSCPLAKPWRSNWTFHPRSTLTRCLHRFQSAPWRKPFGSNGRQRGTRLETTGKSPPGPETTGRCAKWSSPSTPHTAAQTNLRTKPSPPPEGRRDRTARSTIRAETTAWTFLRATSSAVCTTARTVPCTAKRSEKSSSIPQPPPSSSMSTGGAASATPPVCCSQNSFLT
ncbi:MAG: hypothetical protein ACTHL6_01955 [Arthrobacter sp.]